MFRTQVLRVHCASVRRRYLVPVAFVLATAIAYAASAPTVTSIAAAAVPTQSVGALKALRVELPCTAPMDAVVGCKSASPLTTAAILTGEAGTLYDVVLRFRGVVEQKTYTGGSADGSWYVGGAGVAGDGFNSYWLTIQDPPQTYFLNAGSSFIFQSFPIDYTRTVRVAAGSIVALSADAGDGMEVRNFDATGVPIVISGLQAAPQPFDGQLVQMDVVAVNPVR